MYKDRKKKVNRTTHTGASMYYRFRKNEFSFREEKKFIDMVQWKCRKRIDRCIVCVRLSFLRVIKLILTCSSLPLVFIGILLCDSFGVDFFSLLFGASQLCSFYIVRSICRPIRSESVYIRLKIAK